MPTMIPRLSRIAVVLLLFCFVLSDFLAKTDAASESSNERIVCYYTNWAVYRQGIAKYSPENINPYLCTHLIYAFGGLTKDFELKPFDNYQDIEKGGYGKFVGLKTYNKELKTLIAVGGWNEGSTRWSPLVASKEHRHTFIRSAIRFLRTYNFDGLDLDWEYPAFRDGGQPEDKDNYATLVQELRTAFEREAAKSKKDRLLLTMAVPAGKEYIDRGYDIPKLNKYLDFFNMLTYDYHSAFEPQANHHAPLYIRRGLSDFDIKAELNIDFTVRYYVEEGADRDKLVVGIPTYGRSYTLFNPDSHDIGSPAEGPGEAGKYTKEKGYMAFYEVCENIAENEWQVKKVDPGAVGPYAYKGSQWVGYDDEQIAARKAMYVRDQKLGGIMFWSIDNDDFRGLCNGQPYPLIEGAKSALLSKSNSTSTTSGSKNAIAASTKDSSRSPKSKLASTSDSGSSSSTSSRLNTLNNRRNLLNRTPSTSSTRSRRPTNPSLDEIRRSKETTSAEEKTTPKPAAADPLSTPEPPTTPDPGTDFTCKEEGFFSHPRQCSKYFWCLDTPNLGLVSHQFTCPAGLYFNKISGSCDYPNNVICAKPKESTKAAFKTTTPTPTTPFSEDAAVEEERPRGYQLPTDEELFGGLDEEPTTTTTRKPEVTTKKRQRLTAVVVTTPRPTSVTSETDEASLQELLSVIDGLGGVSAVKSLLAKSGGRINTISPQLTHLDAEALDRAVSALDSGHRKPNSLSFNGARGPQFTPSDNDADAEAAESADGQSRGQDNAEAGSLPSNQRGPQYVVFDRRKNAGVNEEEEEEEAEPTEVPERQQRVTFNYVTIDRRSSSTTPASSDDGAIVDDSFNGDQEVESKDGQFVDGPSEDGSTFTVFAQPDRNNGRFTPSAKPSSLFRTTTAASVFPEYVTIRRENPQPAEEEEEDYVDEPATDGVIESSPEAPSSTEKAIHIRPLSFRRTRPPLTTTTTTPRPAVDRSRVRIKAPSPPSTTRRPSVTPSRSAVFDVAKRRNNPLNSNRPPSRLFPRRDPPSTETSVEVSSANPSLRIDDEAEVEEGEKKENVTITVTFREEIRSQSEQQPGGRTIRNRVKTTEIPLEDADKVSAADIFDSVGSSPGSRLDEVDEPAQLTSAATGVSPVSTEAPESVEESSPSSPAPVRGRAGVRARVSLANILRAASPDRRNPLVGRRTRPVGLPAARSTFGAEDSSSAASDADSAAEQPASGRSVPEAEQEPAVVPSRQQRGRRPGIVRTRARLPLRTGRVFASSTEASIGDTSDGSAVEESAVAVSASPRPIRRRPVRVRQQQFTPPPSARVRSRTRLPVGSTTAAVKAAESDSNTNEEAIQTNEEIVSERPARRPAPARVNVRRRPIQSTTESSPAVDAGEEQQSVRGVSIRPLSRPTPPVSRPNRRLVNRRPFITPASALRGTTPSTSSATPAFDDVTSRPASIASGLLDEGEELSSFGAEEPSPRQPKHDSKPRSAREFSAPVIVPRIGDLSKIDIAGVDNRRQQRAEIDETQFSASTDVLFATAPFTTVGVSEKEASIFSKSTPFGSKSTPPVEPNTPTATFTPIDSEYHTETFAVDVGAIDVSVISPKDSSAVLIPERQQGRSVNGNWNSQNDVSPSPLRIKSVSPASSLLDAFRHQPPTFDFALFRSPAAPQQQSLFDADNAKGGQRFVSPSPASFHFSLKPDSDYNYVYYDEPDYDTANLGTDNKFVDYYDSVLRLEKKLQTYADGRIRCLDAGVFAHPQSCKKFVNCVREKDGALKGWVYTCPSNLAFDPIGAMCNWNDATFCGKGSSNDSARGKA